MLRRDRLGLDCFSDANLAWKCRAIFNRSFGTENPNGIGDAGIGFILFFGGGAYFSDFQSLARRKARFLGAKNPPLRCPDRLEGLKILPDVVMTLFKGLGEHLDAVIPDFKELCRLLDVVQQVFKGVLDPLSADCPILKALKLPRTSSRRISRSLEACITSFRGFLKAFLMPCTTFRPIFGPLKFPCKCYPPRG